MTAELLQVRDLAVSYHTASGPVRAVNGVSFTVGASEKLGLVGESGCGKTTTAFAIMRLIKPPGRIERGEIRLGELSLLDLSAEAMRQARFAQVSLIPQGAMNSLNPVMRVGDQLADTIAVHEGHQPRAALAARIAGLLEQVGLPRRVPRMFPHELSGGMKQRVCIAMAITLHPRLIIADEPTSALDVVVQRQVMETLDAAQRALGAAVILVGHDMGLMAQFVDRIGVMYAGKLAETGSVGQILREPRHPYTQLLIASVPSLASKRLATGIPGVAPSLLNPPSGCLFHPRCPQAMPQCSTAAPELRQVAPGRWVACHLYEALP